MGALPLHLHLYPGIGLEKTLATAQTGLNLSPRMTGLPQRCPALLLQPPASLLISKTVFVASSLLSTPQCPSPAWFSADESSSFHLLRPSECSLSTTKLTSLQHQYVCAVPSPVTDYKSSLCLCHAKLSTWALDPILLTYWRTAVISLS